MESNTKMWVSYLGLTLEDQKLQKLLSDYGFKKKKPKMDDYKGDLEEKKKGLLVHFTDECYIRVKPHPYSKGAIVLTGFRFIGIGNNYYKHRFQDQPPHGLSFEMDREAAFKKMGKKPDIDQPDIRQARWDFKDHWFFVSFNEARTSITSMSLALPS